MDVNQFETVSEALNYLIKEGYSHNFEISQNIARCIETNKSYKPTEITIISYHRFEGSSSAGDMSAIYVIQCSDGIKGTLLDAYGTYSNHEFSDFISQVAISDNLS